MWKRPGETPLEALKRSQKALGWSEVSMTYAGRLDPIAEGVLPIVYGSAIAQKESVISLPKTYEARIVFGFETDSFDILGIPSAISGESAFVQKVSVEETLRSLDGGVDLAIPRYASVPVDGTPLHELARRGEYASEDSLPRRTMCFSNCRLLSLEDISAEALRDEIIAAISRVRGDFRQERIQSAWQSHLSHYARYRVARITVSCTSGSYIRSFAHELGKRLGTSACILTLSRSAVGEWRQSDCIPLP